MVRLRGWLLFAGIWAFLVVYFTAWDRWAFGMPLAEALPLNACQDAVWAALALLLARIGRRHPVLSLALPSWKALAVNVGAAVGLAFAGLVFAWACVLVLAFGNPLRLGGRMLLEHLLAFLRLDFHSVMLAFFALAGGYQLYLGIARVRRRDVEHARLESSLAQARYEALLSRFQPHFLFNTLNSISALIHADPEGADRMVSLLADLLRLTLKASGSPTIPLGQELDMVRTFLAIEQVRFGDRLRVDLDVPPALLAEKVPSFILQPLVENSLKHGIGARGRGGRIAIGARKGATALELAVQDDGTGFEEVQEGIGLSGTRARLALLYPGRSSLEIFSLPDRGTRTLVRVPLAEAALTEVPA